MYKAARKLHLWVGLILAAVLFVEAVTGLLLAEPWLAGRETQPMPPGQRQETTRQDDKAAATAKEREKQPPGGVYGVAKSLHQGRVGSVDLGWIIDFSAVGLMVLTVTGVYLAIPILRARSRRR